MELVPQTILHLHEARPAFCLDSYVVLERLGMGGSAVVYKVEHLDTQDIRAIKISLEPCKVDLDSDLGELVQPDAEWKTYRRLNYGLKLAHSAGVPTVYEIGHAKLELAFAPGTQTHQYMIMELLGGDLDAEIRRRHGMGKVPSHEFQKLALRMLDNLQYLHKAGVVHRDIKPMNYCVPLNNGDFSQAYITDFGLSDVRPVGAAIHHQADFVGTIDFASSTALRGCCQGPRDDLEGLLYTLMEISLGVLPWDGDQGIQAASSGLQSTQAVSGTKQCIDTPTRKLRVPQAIQPESPAEAPLFNNNTSPLTAAAFPKAMAAHHIQLSVDTPSGETSDTPYASGECVPKTASNHVLTPSQLATIAAGHEAAWDRWRERRLLPMWAVKWRKAARILTASDIPDISLFKAMILAPNYNASAPPASPVVSTKRPRTKAKENIAKAACLSLSSTYAGRADIPVLSGDVLQAKKGKFAAPSHRQPEA